MSLAELRKQSEKEKAAPGSTPPAAVSRIKPAVVVDMTGSSLGFQPATIKVKAGQTVVWKNSSSEVHTVTADLHVAINAKDVELPKGSPPAHAVDYRYCASHNNIGRDEQINITGISRLS